MTQTAQTVTAANDRSIAPACHRITSLLRRLGGALLLIGIAHVSLARAETSRLPVATFFQNPTFSSAALSPNARFVAALVSAPDGRVQLAVLDLGSMTPKIVAGFPDADIRQFHWVNDNRLIFDVSDRETAQGDVRSGPGLYVVERDGSNSRTLVARAGSTGVTATARDPLPRNLAFFSTITGIDSEDVFVVQQQYTNRRQPDALSLLRLNTTTGRAVAINRPGASRYWLIDQNGEPRLTVTHEDNISTLYAKESAADGWRKISTFDVYDDFASFTPVAIGPDGTVYVSARAKGQDKLGIYLYDMKQNKIASEPLVSLVDYDFSGSFIRNREKILGVRYLTDAESTIWFDERMKKIQKDIDTLLPATVNRVSVGANAQTPFLLVQAFSDIQPSVFMLYDTAAGKLTTLGQAFPGIVPDQMATKDMVRYKARDGLPIPAYLTLPNNGPKKNLPMVVLVHGGPYVRGGTWNWNGEAQFLASRGYAVLEPEFRGSVGFGSKHFRAGWKQWGLAMQNDIADGTKWAIAQQIADPKRICIAGASYGGYATLMGLINDPSLFKCGINWVGVTDIDLMYSITWSDSSDEWQTYGMPRLVGDREKDAAQLKATSPLLLASRITQPLLLAYGGADRRVPIEHGTSFRDAVSRTNRNVEWVEYPNEGHGWALIKTRVDFWSRVEKFLDSNIGKP